ncbi:hypothetical protein, partial [Acinetobacter baumannii]|uniref:hypothetical protein n=1 Tax=Acinetobacter baumannii TaxID=470 RepID=UPI001BC87C2F
GLGFVGLGCVVVVVFVVVCFVWLGCCVGGLFGVVVFVCVFWVGFLFFVFWVGWGCLVFVLGLFWLFCRVFRGGDLDGFQLLLGR